MVVEGGGERVLVDAAAVELVPPTQRFDEQLVLRREVVQEPVGAHLHGVRDRGDRGPGVALGRDHAQGGVENLAASLDALRVWAAGAHGGRC